MNSKALHKISYGMYIVSSQKGDAINGQIANTVFQITSDPATVAVSINRQNLTYEFIRESKLFGISVLERETPLAMIGRFGFKTGREINKFEEIDHRTSGNGIPYPVEFVLAFLEAEVIQEIDMGTHTVFIGRITDAQVFGDGEPMTYAYYHQVKKGTVPKTAPTYIEKQPERKAAMDKYICKVCGYIYDPEAGDPENGVDPGTPFEKLPEDWVCPVCGAGKEEFEKQS